MPSADEKPDLTNYPAWHLDLLKEDIESRDLETRFNANAALARTTIDSHPFITSLSNRLKLVLQDSDTLAAYAEGGSYELVLNTKPFASVVDKTYRLNCNWNSRFPREPRDGWIVAKRWFTKLDDIVRTSVVCRYIDGPERISAIIKEEANSAGLNSSYSARATDQGYYAFHNYVEFPIRLMDLGSSNAAEQIVKLEIQVTTQLQEVLKSLTHHIYRDDRVAPRIPATELRWDYRASRFRASYLGHTLHLIESILLELRAEVAHLSADQEVSSQERAD